ncbi:MAG TPA: valine--tRNA ligase [Anaerolineaceae bacterium]
MTIAKNYSPQQAEPDWQARWQNQGTYHFDLDDPRPVYAIDTPPATVSGKLHVGHVYSYSHADFMARYHRMRGVNVYYPMGFDDNGLPTERFVEKTRKVSAMQVGRQAFIQQCLEVSEEEERNYRALWQRLGLSVDWRYSYRTIDEHSRRCSQYSFIDLCRKGLAYRAKAPMIWCPECRTAIAQAELEDRERESEWVTLPFTSAAGGDPLRIATTRPELLAACVAVFVHPADARYASRVGSQVIVPLYGQRVPVLADAAADPQKGTGAVMCCTFGDQTDAAWWQSHRLPLVEAIGADGRMLWPTDLPGLGETLAGLKAPQAREKIKEILAAQGLILARAATSGTIRVHERCDTPVEVLVTAQWFIRILENKQKFLELGEQVHWHPASMQARYRAWVENLSWDWCISRQRAYGVPFPAWYCKQCGAIALADEGALPVDPLENAPGHPCAACGATDFEPDRDVMDTWATSSLTPEIVTGWLDDPERFARLFPMTLRPQAYEIIRTWAFDSIVKAWYHFGRLPWNEVFISGWAVAGKGMEKISKSKGSGTTSPMQMIERYSADALRYWAASTSTGKDTIVSEEKMQMGVKLVTKLWNVARFAAPFIAEGGALQPREGTPGDRWILASLDGLVERVTAAFEDYEYAQAKAEIESFFWRDLADNYLEMAKLRLYDPQHPAHQGARRALSQVLRTLLLLLAPLLPFVTEEIWQALFAGQEDAGSIHTKRWPVTASDSAERREAIVLGERLVTIASAARRYKSEHALSLGSELACLRIHVKDAEQARAIAAAVPDLISITRARQVDATLVAPLEAALEAMVGPSQVDGVAVEIVR